MAFPSEVHISYFGQDLNYWRKIQEGISSKYVKDSYSKFKFTHINTQNKADQTGHNAFIWCLENTPHIYYVDFSTNEESAFNLSKLLRINNTTQDAVVVGLVDYLGKTEKTKLLNQCLIALSHIKSNDVFDVIYDAMTKRFPDNALKPEFAMALLNHDVELIQDFQVIFCNKEKLRIEGPHELEVGKENLFDWEVKNGILLSKVFEVDRKSKYGNSIPHYTAYDLSYKFADPMPLEKQKQLIKKYSDPYKKPYNEADLEAASEEDEDQISDALIFSDADDEPSELILFDDEEEKDSDILPELKANLKGRFYDWIKSNKSRLRPYEVKILFISKQGDFLQGLSSPFYESEDHVYFTARLVDVDQEIEHLRPDIIAFEFEAFPEDLAADEPRENYNNIEALREIVHFASHSHDYNPFILVFGNPTYTTQSCRDAFEYAQMMAHPNKIEFSLIEKVARKLKDALDKRQDSLAEKKMQELKKKNPEKFEDLQKDEVIEKRLVFSRQDKEKRISRKIPIKLLSLTETEVSFVSKEKLSDNATYRLDTPIDMQITTVPVNREHLSSKMENSYRGLIHSISEANKQKLRQFVNSIFCLDVEQQRKLEKEQFEEIKRRYLNNESD